MSEEKNTFPNGMITKKGNVDFVKAKVSFKVDEFVQWLHDNQKNGWVNVDILESKQGNVYAKLNDFTPEKKEVPQAIAQDESNDLPF
jgi:hypothetical protein